MLVGVGGSWWELVLGVGVGSGVGELVLGVGRASDGIIERCRYW